MWPGVSNVNNYNAVIIVPVMHCIALLDRVRICWSTVETRESEMRLNLRWLYIILT